MSNHPGVHVVNPEKFDPGTAQTPGSERLAAITPQLGIETAMWGVYSKWRRALTPEFIITASSRRSLTSCRASARSAGAKKANMPRRPKPATSSMCLLSWSIWKSTCRIRCLSDGWWFGVLRRRLSLIFLKILGPQEARRTRGCARARLIRVFRRQTAAPATSWTTKALDGARPDNERRLRSLGSFESWTRNGTDEISYAVCASVGAARAPSSPPTRFTKTEISTALMSRSPTSSRPCWTPFLRRGFEIKEYGTLGCRPQSERETSKRFAQSALAPPIR
jgi:hypothetical protein